MIVPLVARGRTLESLTCVSLTPNRRYGEGDVVYAEEIGRRAGVAIDNARLYRQTERARAEAEAANLAKDDFLAILSHELRTPLYLIAGRVQMLQHGHGFRARTGSRHCRSGIARSIHSRDRSASTSRPCHE
jgi:GAF domain-containing protein